MAIPGANRLIGGTKEAGYFGIVPSSELITGDALASATGYSQGISQYSSEGWLKFAFEGKVLFVAKKPIKNGISWNSLNGAGLVIGKNVTIGGLVYKVRLFRGALTDPVKYGDADKGAFGSEWNRLMLPIHKNAPSKWINPSTGGITENWGIGFTDGDLHSHDSLGSGAYTMCQETNGLNSLQSLMRGGKGVSFTEMANKSLADALYGWRPVLELLNYEISTKPKLSANINGVYKNYSDGFVKIDGVWRQIAEIHTKINGVWRKS